MISERHRLNRNGMDVLQRRNGRSIVLTSPISSNPTRTLIRIKITAEATAAAVTMATATSLSGNVTSATNANEASTVADQPGNRAVVVAVERAVVEAVSSMTVTRFSQLRSATRPVSATCRILSVSTI
jgi:hypothetical protein